MRKSLIGILILVGIFVAGCDSVDLSQVTKEDVNKVIVCPEKYIRFGADCCLDLNDNSICDSDEAELSSDKADLDESKPIEEPQEKPKPIKPVYNSWKSFMISKADGVGFFKIYDFTGEKILVGTVAAWNPLSTKQLENIKALHEIPHLSFVSVSLYVDPSETKAVIKNKIDEKSYKVGYNGLPSEELNQMLVDEFGDDITNTAKVPMILICEDGSTKLLDWGLKSTEYLEQKLKIACAVAE